jgi:hypothetical protein
MEFTPDQNALSKLKQSNEENLTNYLFYPIINSI